MVKMSVSADITAMVEEPSQSQVALAPLELMDMTGMRESPTPTLSTTSPQPYFSRGATQQSEDIADAGPEEMQPLQASASVQNNKIPTIPKNRRRPGSSSDGNRVTMTGTVMQGSTGGQPVEVEVELSEREFQRLTSRECQKQRSDACTCGRKQGPHIVLWSFLCIPVAFLISLCLSFYNGSIAWYNIFIYLSEEKSIVHRVTLCPILILSFPLTIGLSTLCIAIVASLLQVSWYWIRWKMEILDGEKGFYGWICNKMKLPDCSPYQVVILEENMNF